MGCLKAFSSRRRKKLFVPLIINKSVDAVFCIVDVVFGNNDAKSLKNVAGRLMRIFY